MKMAGEKPLWQWLAMAANGNNGGTMAAMAAAMKAQLMAVMQRKKIIES